MHKAIWFVLVVFMLSLNANAGGGHHHDFPVGEMTKAQVLENENFGQNYQDYVVSELEASKVQSWGKNVRIDVFFGMWCHDSEREVPKLLKLLASEPGAKLNLYALDIKKSDPKGLAKANKVKYTPTVIVYQDDKEVGRIIERPQSSLVNDIHAMLAK